MKNHRNRKDIDVYGILTIGFEEVIQATNEFDACFTSDCLLHSLTILDIKVAISTKCGELFILKVHDWEANSKIIGHISSIGFIKNFQIEKEISLCFSFTNKTFQNEVLAITNSQNLLCNGNIHNIEVVIKKLNGEILHPLIQIKNIIFEDAFEYNLVI